MFFSLCSATTGSSEHLSTTSSWLEKCCFACAKIKVHPLSTAKYVGKHMFLWPQIIRLVGLLSFFVIHTDLWFLHFFPENFGFAQFFFEKFITRYQWPRGIQKQNLAFTSQNTPMWNYKHTFSQWASLLHSNFVYYIGRWVFRSDVDRRNICPSYDFGRCFAFVTPTFL